jgi:ABC-2 type transport system ATP-binding protein
LIVFFKEQVKMNLVIETEGLGKRYREITAVADLSLRVEPGEIYAFLGLNGAGKTTTVRMLLGMIRPTSGRASILGEQIGLCRNELWHSVGYLVETPHAYPELTVRENLEVIRRLRPGVAPKMITNIIDRLGLSAFADRRTATLSLGNSQRLGLAKALLHHPKVLILDEPANGLDPAGIVEIRKLLLELTQEHGVTVFMSSHILAEVARLAHRIGIIHDGRLLQELDAERLDEQRHRCLLIRTGDSKMGRDILGNAGYSAMINTEDVIVLNDTTALGHPDRLATILVNAGCAPFMIRTEEEDLEQYFLRLVGTTNENS